MATITFPVWTVVDDAGAVVTGATVTITSVKDKTGADIASHGAVVNAVDGSDVLTGANISVDYDPEAKGEAWIVLSISKVGSTFSGLNAAPAFFAAKDSGRVLADLPGTGTVVANATKIAGQTITASAGVTFPASVASQTVAPTWASVLPVASTGTIKDTTPRTAHQFVLENQTGSRLASRWHLFLSTYPGLPLRVASIADSSGDWLVTMTDDLPDVPAVGATASIVGFAGPAPLESADVAGAILANPTNKLVTDSSGRVVIDPTTNITDTQAATVGGALAGAWALSWGKARTNSLTSKLEVWGPGNATVTPSATFAVDSVTNPTVRTLD